MTIGLDNIEITDRMHDFILYLQRQREFENIQISDLFNQLLWEKFSKMKHSDSRNELKDFPWKKDIMVYFRDERLKDNPYRI